MQAGNWKNITHTHTHKHCIHDRNMSWQSLGAGKDQYTWDEGWSRPFFKLCGGLAETPAGARRGHRCQGYFPSSMLMSYKTSGLLDHYGEGIGRL